MNAPDFSNVMLDLETMGNGPNAAIVAIGAVAFNIQDTEISADNFYTRVRLESSVEHGGVIDSSTVLWWMEQSEEARSEIAKKDGLHIIDALEEFSHWIRTAAAGDESHVWGNGASFDNVILRSAYQRRRIEPPWLWWNDRCYRTVKALHRDVPFERLGTHHKAIDDAISQAQHLIRMLNPDARKPGCIKGGDCTIGTGYCTGCCS